MIFVTVGTSSWDFTRLIKEMDRIAGMIDEGVVMQISDTQYLPQNAKYFRFTSDEEYKRLFESARVIVSHAGVGTIITALHYNKPIIVVPRRKVYGEHVDDHQIEITRELEQEGKIIALYDINGLESALREIDRTPASTSRDKEMVNRLKEYLNNLDGKNR